MCHLFFLFYFSILVDIFSKLISGYFPNKWYQNWWFLGNKMSAMKFDVEKFDGRINFGLWQVQVKDLLIRSGHIKKNCTKCRAGLANGFDSQTNIVTFDDEIL